jgi:TRAP-type C4-dicarboxylate transport system permease large subunit
MSRAKAIGTFTEITGIFVVVIGGIYFGFVTATEAAGLGALAALVVMIGERFSAGGRALAKDVGASLLETLHVSAMLFALMVGAGMLSHYMVLSGVSSWLVNGVSGLDVAPIFIVIGFLLILIPLGMILDGFAMLLITLPLAYPVVTSLGYDGIWFGILMVKMIEFGLITPPVGMNLFVLSGVRKDITVQDTVRGLMPFYIAEAVTIAVLVAFPAITLFLPQSAGY